jgi:TRAP-type C4-dicarboxylate transport system permease small subunit
MGIVISVALVVLYGMSFPAVWKYVTFMKVESSSYLHIRMDWMYSIYIVFAAAIILRSVWIGVQWLRNQDPEVIDPTQVGSGL